MKVSAKKRVKDKEIILCHNTLLKSKPIKGKKERSYINIEHGRYGDFCYVIH